METPRSPDQSAALAATPNSRLTVIDPATRQRYVLVSADEYTQLEDFDAIRRGISVMEAGEGKPLADAMNDVRQSLESR